MSLRVNLLFHLHHETEAERSTPRAYGELLSLIELADGLPIGCAWLAEHHLSPTRGRLPAPLLFAVAAARQTRRITLGPCVIVLPLHHPLDVAEQMAEADVLMEGRLAVGLGSGGNPDELAAFGVAPDERRGRFAEGITIVSGLLGGEPFGYRGRYYSIPEVTLVPRPTHLTARSLWIAAGSEESAALAGRADAHLLLARGTTEAALRAQIGAYQAARGAPKQAQGSRRIQTTRGIYVAESERTAWLDAAQGIRRHYARLARFGGEEVDLRTMAERGDFIVGTPEQCADRIAALCSAVPITDLACDVSLIGMPVELVRRSLDLLGRAVVPRVGDLA